jgi:hypothetical protein
LIENIACRTILTSDHYTNYLDLSGKLPEHKERILGHGKEVLKWLRARL